MKEEAKNLPKERIHNNHIRLDRMTIGEIQGLIEAFRYNSKVNQEHSYSMRDYTCKLFEYAFFGTDKRGRLLANGMEARHIVSFGKSLTEYRIYNQEVHDKYYEIAFRKMPTDPLLKEKYINSLLHYSSQSVHKHNYEKVITFMI